MGEPILVVDKVSKVYRRGLLPRRQTFSLAADLRCQSLAVDDYWRLSTAENGLFLPIVAEQHSAQHNCNHLFICHYF